MAILKESYNENTLTDMVWYDSSSILYSKYVENKDFNYGDLYVVFKNKTAYRYSDVDLTHDYVMFKHGGTDGSQGKALNQFIKGKYDYVKIDNFDISDFEKPAENKDILNTYFISGHRDITEKEFTINYAPIIEDIITNVPNAKFIMGDYCGVDIMAQNYIIDVAKYNPDFVTVYHMMESPRNINSKIKNLVGGFKTDEERDAAMTANSFEDIAFIRNHNLLSGTAQNILRRKLLK